MHSPMIDQCSILPLPTNTIDFSLEKLTFLSANDRDESNACEMQSRLDLKLFGKNKVHPASFLPSSTAEWTSVKSAISVYVSFRKGKPLFAALSGVNNSFLLVTIQWLTEYRFQSVFRRALLRQWRLARRSSRLQAGGLFLHDLHGLPSLASLPHSHPSTDCCCLSQSTPSTLRENLRDCFAGYHSNITDPLLHTFVCHQLDFLLAASITLLHT